jgi:hypothetical protein
MIYLASPYNDWSKVVIQDRMEKIYSVIGRYTKEGIHVTTPLFMHEVVTRHDIAGDYAFWERYCLNLLNRCDKMFVLRLKGWDTSRGVTAEIAFCAEHNIPVEYIDYIEPECVAPCRLRKLRTIPKDAPFTSDDVEKRIDHICGCKGKHDCDCVTVFSKAFSQAWYKANSGEEMPEE